MVRRRPRRVSAAFRKLRENPIRKARADPNVAVPSRCAERAGSYPEGYSVQEKVIRNRPEPGGHPAGLHQTPKNGYSAILHDARGRMFMLRYRVSL